MATTPGRKPLSTLQMVAENFVVDGTPSSAFSKTPKRSSGSVVLTPNVKTTRHSRRSAKRKSVPSRLSKSCSAFEKDLLTRTTGTTAKVSDHLLGIQDCSGETSQLALNEMLREKVFETVSKMKEVSQIQIAFEMNFVLSYTIYRVKDIKSKIQCLFCQFHVISYVFPL